MAVASSCIISLYFNTISFLIWHRVKRATAVRRYSRLTNIFLLHFCLLYNRLACLTLQGDRGRDGFEGQKGEPVSRSTRNFTSSTVSSVVDSLIQYVNDINSLMRKWCIVASCCYGNLLNEHWSQQARLYAMISKILHTCALNAP